MTQSSEVPEKAAPARKKTKAPAKPRETSVTTFTTKRGRPSASQVAAIDSAIIAMAKKLFLENGYANTSMEAVAGSLGVSKGTLYSRYPNKSDLFRAIVAERLTAWTPVAEEFTEQVATDVAELLFHTGVRFLSAFSDPEVAAFDHLIVSEAPRFPELFREFYDQGYAPFTERVIGDIERLSAKAGWPINDARSVAMGFISSLLGWYRMTILSQELTPQVVAHFVARQVAILVGGRAAW